MFTKKLIQNEELLKQYIDKELVLTLDTVYDAVHEYYDFEKKCINPNAREESKTTIISAYLQTKRRLELTGKKYVVNLSFVQMMNKDDPPETTKEEEDLMSLKDCMDACVQIRPLIDEANKIWKAHEKYTKKQSKK